ncbi:MAG TPA: hypothetical protein VF064_09580 [Pyrinomonadaceae bacterium]
MYSFRNSLAALVGLLLLVAASAVLLPLAGRGQTDSKNPLRRDPRKSYYLTQTRLDGSQALTACAAGYHMASLWEIHDPSNLRYDTELGLTRPDSGFGPPSGFTTALNLVVPLGWIRTGGHPNAGPEPGLGNCNVWTSADGADGGTVVYLADRWDATTLEVTSPWVAETRPCDFTARVWCVQD